MRLQSLVQALGSAPDVLGNGDLLKVVWVEAGRISA
jgi:hypothetical protein